MTITGVSGSLSHSVTIAVSVAGIKKDAVAVDLSSSYNVKAIYADGSKYDAWPVPTVKASPIRKNP